MPHPNLYTYLVLGEDGDIDESTDDFRGAVDTAKSEAEDDVSADNADGDAVFVGVYKLVKVVKAVPQTKATIFVTDFKG